MLNVYTLSLRGSLPAGSFWIEFMSFKRIHFFYETQGYNEARVSALLASELLGLPFSANQEELLLNHSTHCNCSIHLKRLIHSVCTSVHCC